jgi:hypothetical protein
MTTMYTTLEIEVDGDWELLEFEVEYNAEPFVPAKFSGHPDTWCPAEGGEVEITDVLCTTTGQHFDADDFVFGTNWHRVATDEAPTYTTDDLETECREHAADCDPY